MTSSGITFAPSGFMAPLLSILLLLATTGPGPASSTDIDNCALPATGALETRAESGDRESQYRLGRAQWESGCEGSAASALVWLTRAAEAGHPNAAHFLGSMHLGAAQKRQDWYKAQYFLGIAARAGHVAAQHDLGVLILLQARGNDDRDLGLYWMGAAAGQGDGFSAAAIGMIHERGLHGVQSDRCLALDWYAAAEELGFRDLLDHHRSLRMRSRDLC